MSDIIDDKEAERHWDGLWNEQKDDVATRAGLLRSSAFTRSLPYWKSLPIDWHTPLSEVLKADREKRKADEAARAAEIERLERVELARLLAKYGSPPETGALCPHGMPLAENVCGPCSQGRPNTMSVNEAEPARPCYASGVAGICRLPAGHDGTHAFS